MVKKIFSKSYKSNFLIAEIGINHNGNLNQAFKLIDAAKKGLADAVKFQTYTTEKRVKKNSPIFKILKKCELRLEDFYKLKKYCEKKKIIFFSTPFDNESVIFLNKIKVPMFKISSFDIGNTDLIKEIIKTKKPTIISTGMASIKEINNSYQKFRKNNVPISLLHCISSYPNLEKNSYLSNIKDLKNKFNCTIGLSDHTNKIKTSIYSYISGARIFEKHFYLGKRHKCVDAPVSIDSIKMKELKEELSNIDNIFGKIRYGIRKGEEFASQFRRKKEYWKYYIEFINN